MNNSKKRITIISASYPYGLHETFLHNEVLFLSRHFDVELYPMLKKKKGTLIKGLPSNVKYHHPILKRNYLLRIAQGIANTSPLLPHLKDLIYILKKPVFLKDKFFRWLLNLIVFRTFHASHQFQEIIESDSAIIYFYWGHMPINLLKSLNKKIFIRIHGGEVDLKRNHNYIPLLQKKILNDNHIHYLPVSECAALNLNTIHKIRYTINRLGVYDNGLNPTSKAGESLRIVSCSSVIKLKRVHLIINSLQLIKEIEIEWIHFGDGALMSEILELSKSLPKNIKVILHGRVPNTKVLEFYSQFHVDLFINVSSTEGIPVSIMEAFSFGIPCFATNAGGTKEIVNSKNGCLANKDFPLTDLSKFIVNIRNVSNENCMREYARKTFEQFYNAKKNYAGLVNIFSQ